MSWETPNKLCESDQPTIPALLAEQGGSYAAALGIELDGLRPEEVYKWFLAAVLFGARISERLATRTWREFERSGVLTPQHMLDTGWEGLVRILDRGGYTRYDYKTATKLLEINRTLLADYGGNLNALHAAATDSVDLERRVRRNAQDSPGREAHLATRLLGCSRARSAAEEAAHDRAVLGTDLVADDRAGRGAADDLRGVLAGVTLALLHQLTGDRYRGAIRHDKPVERQAQRGRATDFPAARNDLRHGSAHRGAGHSGAPAVHDEV